MLIRRVDAFIDEGRLAAFLYGADQPPASEAELQASIRKMRPHLERSGIVFEFLEILRRVPLAGPLSRPLNQWLVRAAIDLVPPAVREIAQPGAWVNPDALTSAASAEPL